METSLIENYLSRYINRVAISRNRFNYIEDQQKVEILYNDYRNQKEGKAAPKRIKTLEPLLAIHQIMAHVLPPYFQKARYYGLHSVASFKRLQDKIPDKIKRNGQSIRTLFEILNHLLKIPPYKCEGCKSENYEILEIPPDRSWARFIVYQITSLRQSMPGIEILNHDSETQPLNSTLLQLAIAKTDFHGQCREPWPGLNTILSRGYARSPTEDKISSQNNSKFPIFP